MSICKHYTGGKMKKQYENEEEAVKEYLELHKNLKTAILKAQVMKNKSVTEFRYNFWLNVENKLKELLPKKKKKWEK